MRGAARIAVLGAIGPIKGFDVLLKLARQSKSGGPPASFIVIGYTRNDEAARAAGIHVTGPYKDRDVAAHIETIDPDVIFIPSTWPETFCYTLSHAMRSGRPVAAFDLGAQGRRLNERSPSGVIPLDLAHKPGALLPRLVAIARQGAGPAPSGSALPESTLAT